MEKQVLASIIATTESGPSYPTIVLTDDDLEDCALFEEGFTSLHLHACLVVLHDGEQLMEFLQESPLPALLFLDLNMPRKNGQQCLLDIKADPRLEKLPVVVLSTSTYPAQLASIMEAGAEAYYSKPSSFILLARLIEEAVQKVLQPAILAYQTQSHRR